MEHASHSTIADMEHVFTDHQWQDFHKEDVKAGSAVVMLMLSIFLVGVVLYTIVAATL